MIITFCISHLKEPGGEGHVAPSPNLFSLCSCNKIPAFFPIDEIINSRGQTSLSAASCFVARRETSLLPRPSMVKSIIRRPT